MPEAMLKHRPGIKPPNNSATEGWTWEGWNREMLANPLAGWGWCCFGNRMRGKDVEFVFGHVRGSFGLWRKPFMVCYEDLPGTPQREEILTCITHLSSGLGIGIFADRHLASEACELAEKVADWSNVDPEDEATWKPLHERTVAAWKGIGVCTASNSHAHERAGDPMMFIFGRDDASLTAGRPERLS